MLTQIVLEWELDGAAAGCVVREGQAVLIGRSADCDVVIGSPTVSRQHAVAFLAGEALCVRNLSGTNPVYLRGEEPLAAGATARVAVGEAFRLGPATFRVCAGESDSSRGSTAPEWSAPESNAPAALRLRCPRCRNLLEYNREGYCEHCGLSRMNAETVVA
jgi:predicted component of type VI protein secretion system